MLEDKRMWESTSAIESAAVEKPGRQVVTFLFFFNISQWLSYTCLYQKVEATPFEREYYGYLPWLVILR